MRSHYSPTKGQAAIVLAWSVLFIFLGTPDAMAQRGGIGRASFGYCVTGTCSKRGTWRARNVKFCQKENCPKGYKDAPR